MQDDGSGLFRRLSLPRSTRDMRNQGRSGPGPFKLPEFKESTRRSRFGAAIQDIGEKASRYTVDAIGVAHHYERPIPKRVRRSRVRLR